MKSKQARPLRIGLDLDNTIIDYSAVFAPVAKQIGLMPEEVIAPTKTEVKDWLRQNSGEESWMTLQGQVYGKYIGQASIYKGCKEFISFALNNGAQVSIVSHKTSFGHFDPAKINLHDAALKWLEEMQFFSSTGIGMKADNVHFRETRAAKIQKISDLECDIFVDDLTEVLLDPSFPQQTKKLWFINGREAQDDCPLKPYKEWDEMLDFIKELF